MQKIRNLGIIMNIWKIGKIELSNIRKLGIIGNIQKITKVEK